MFRNVDMLRVLHSTQAYSGGTICPSIIKVVVMVRGNRKLLSLVLASKNQLFCSTMNDSCELDMLLHLQDVMRLRLSTLFLNHMDKILVFLPTLYHRMMLWATSEPFRTLKRQGKRCINGLAHLKAWFE